MGIITNNAHSLALGFTFPFVCAAVVFVRFYMRRRRGNALLADDWLCLPAYACLLGLCITIIYSVERNVLSNNNLPIEDTVNEQQREFARVTGAIPGLWIFGASSVKMSILFFYRRIFIGRVFNIVSWALIAFNALWTTYAFFAWILFCGRHVKADFEGSWDVCPDYGLRLQIPVYIWDSLIDLCLIILPIPFIVKLQIAAQRKFELLIAFVFGGFALVASLLNTSLQVLTMLNSTIVTNTDPNSPGVNLAYFYWQTLELGVGLITCNLPTLQPMYNSVLVFSWTATVATKRSFSSWRSHYSSIVSSSRKGSMPLSSDGPGINSSGTPTSANKQSTVEMALVSSADSSGHGPNDSLEQV